jgi:hypothetical protein
MSYGRIVFLFLICAFGKISAQSPEEIENIKKLCGCFEVEFKYAETFAPDGTYEFQPRDESYGLELILPVESSDNKIVLQHLLILNSGEIIKHWREDWTYENQVIWEYKGNKVWAKKNLDPSAVKAKWTQSIWEVSDAPRYQGVGNWVMVEGRPVWQSTADAPLPRREYTHRNDYNILRRTNRLILTDAGWTHDQDNQKIIRAGDTDKLLVEEKGVNIYKRVDDKACENASKYWVVNKSYWTNVRKVWDEYVNTHSTIEMKTLVDGKPLHDGLFRLAKEVIDKKISQDEMLPMIRKELDKFLGGDGLAQKH